MLYKYIGIVDKRRLAMSLILCYCEKCGQHYDISDKRLSDLKNVTCTGCCSIGYFKPVPKEYLNNGRWGINKNMQEQFIENIVKSSPNFDQECWDKREAFKEIQKHNDELLENDKIKQSNIPKCPTCGSSNIKRVSGTSKAVSVVMFGLLSQKVKKQFRCNNCGYEW